jgi:ribosomal protein S12 methylthiotransferase
MADAPEIDGSVIIRAAHSLRPGDLVRVHIEATDDYDLTGALVPG